MKNLKRCMGMVAIFALLFTSCSKDENSPSDVPDSENSAVLSFGAVLNDLGNRAMTKQHFDQIPDCSDAEPMVAEIQFSYGETTKTVVVDILSDEDGYFTAYSEDFKIPVPNNSSVTVTLEEFMVYDGNVSPGNPNGNLIWIAPIASTPGQFNGYVDNPLPFDFEVSDGTKPYIDVEVLCFDRRMVNEYGYPFFDIIPGTLYPVCFFANYCTDAGRHYVGNYSVDLYYDDGETRIQLYSSADTSADIDDTDNSADPLCLVIPESPFEDASQDYLFYVITPLDWPGTYGDIDNTPLPEVGLSWNDIDDLLNDDGETTEYIHLFINCDDNPGGGDCPVTPEDSDGDCVPDNEDDCVGDNRIDSDHDGTPDACDICSLGDDSIDTDGDGTPDACDACPNVKPEDDYDGDCIPNGDDDCPYSAENDCDEEEGNCGTAFMFGDVEINSISNSNRWGWAEHWTSEDGTSKTSDIWVGAGQNDTTKGTKAGTVTITTSGDEVHFVINLINGYTIDDLHVQLSEDQPSGNVAKAPGQYNRNDEVGDSDLDFTLTRTSSDSDFWVIVHAGDTCNR